MNLLTIDKVTKGYTDKVLFKEISLGIQEGDKIGVIGVNGTGKSTLLKIIAGIEEADEGEVTTGRNIKVEYLAQQPEFDFAKNILENVMLQDQDSHEKDWNKEADAKSMLDKLGIRDYDGRVDVLSGGQRKRLALVRAILNPADILVLDEPTNHLDNDMAEWLEKYLNQYRGVIVMVTHDRYFLDKVTNRIVEIDNGNIYSYAGGYSSFLELKAQREEMELATERKNKSLYRQDLEWMMRGARARSTKQKAHIERFEQLRDREKPKEAASVEMNSVASRLGKKTIELHEVSKSYGEKVLFRDFTYILLKNDRIGIIGKNGCGKSTLLKVINGIVEPDSGYVEIGETVKIGYFSQENEEMDPNIKVIDYVKSVAEYIATSEGSITASQMLEKFLFTGAMQYSLIGKLSGGEKRRLYLLYVLMGAPNVLFLDEPTNDLDIQTLTILEHYLDTFPGIVVTVSHDRYFLDRMVNRIFAFEGDGLVKQFEGGYSDYMLTKGDDVPEEKKPEKPKEEKKSYQKDRSSQLKFTYSEQKEYDTIDDDIAKLEANIEKLEADMVSNASNYGKLNELMKEKEEREKQLEVKMERWMYLTELAQKIEESK
ncbi:ATP-binding cassette, subfamily F, uup [Anaerosporobacter mobilis DSM 15930]|uniref:ATP-binding cassette, subfamily F, uup n=1 Tax=Anaerosporobacter mobilis DSM 15930 TaxID=1120996 RepID=A0A1M7F3P1_9FIRM|nr:ABC-F family ATP-binding cassette domain-containing protein [Anaerosporobacter mobilis]SHL98702.1 ATP-binding cassette, subfamily F, uup [Anaerosporobacter mobilis DSM 15930]